MKKLKIPEDLTTLAYEAIKKYIWEGGLDGRNRLTEDFFSHRLGISKSPIREALNRLGSEGLIRIEPRRGAFLVAFSVKEVSDLYDMRQALEAHAVVTANVTRDLLERLKVGLERMKKFREANDQFQYIEEDVKFHMFIVGATGNELLSKTLQNLQERVWLFRRETYDLSSSGAVVSHAAIVRALEKGNRAQAVKAMQQHISSVAKKLINYLQNKPTTPKLNDLAIPMPRAL